jgi:hypothetical protein
MSDLNYQQATVMSLAKERLNKLYEFNEMLRKRVAAVCAASTAIVGIVSAAKFLPRQSSGLDVESVLLGLVCLLSVLLYWFAAKSLLPGLAAIPGSTNTDVLFDEYLVKDVEVAFNNFLIDICAASDKALEQNTSNAGILKSVLVVFQVQIAVLAIAIAWSGIAKWSV